ncbi:MAG: Flp pilus assembly complex ATPase component TadA [Rickettsiales bacterium]|jgi:type IV secretory pathway ATPase VirB11/archaellum biosynthesis ATPase|nr:Flp pilus assembly complex ATPase component TadA [Rickettsiales bacterium]
MANEVLNAALARLANWYSQPNIEEIAVNAPGEVWLRLRGRRENPWVAQADKALTREYLTDVMSIVANVYEVPFDPVGGVPVVYATIPGEHRFSAVAGKNVMYGADDFDGGVALAVRVKTEDAAFDFADYGLAPGMDLKKLDRNVAKLPDGAYERLMALIKSGAHILISGATATGKTTFLNNILKLLSRELRVITIEDARELVVPQKNHVHIVLSRTQQVNQFAYKDVIDLVVRMSPDAVMAGEISTENASAVWELMSTGHKNFYATIHAESAEGAYKSFVDRILHTFPELDQDRTLREMRERLHVVQIGREGNVRAITEII